MTRPVTVLVTGCSGFVGRAFAARATSEGCTVIGTSRQPPPEEGAPFHWVRMPDFGDSGWPLLLQQVDVVVHCAARVHQLKERASDPSQAFRKANVDATRQLAGFAVVAGVQRFILLSTIKVNGDQTRPGKPFKASDSPAPSTPYGQSKWEAEQVLKDDYDDRLDWIILRLPLVYGPAAKGNLALFEYMAKCRIPLPLGHIRNRRSLISIEHLVQFLLHCLNCKTVNETVVIADKAPYTTSEIYQMVCRQGSYPAMVFTLPNPLQGLMNWLLKHLGLYERLADSLEIDISDTLERMQWQLPDC